MPPCPSTTTSSSAGGGSGCSTRRPRESSAGCPTSTARRTTSGCFSTPSAPFDGPEPSCVLYGDIHGTYLQGDDNQTLVNVGSVGNPLDATTASYVVVEGVADSLEPAPFGIQFVRVPFDTEAEIAVAFASGMPEAQEYAIELRTGLYRGHQQGA